MSALAEERERERENNLCSLIVLLISQNGALLMMFFLIVCLEHRLDEYSRTALPSNELQVYTW